MRARNLPVLVLAAALALPVVAAEPKPDAKVILTQALAEPDAPFQGRVTLSRWKGADKRSEEANVFFQPPHTYRLEYLTPEGTLDRVVLIDGVRREVQLVKNGVSTVSDDLTDGRAVAAPTGDQLGLLLANYTVSLAGHEKVLSRDAWVLELTPRVPGKPRQRMLVDRVSQVVLEVRRFTDDAGASTQFTRFEPGVRLSGDLFGWKRPARVEKESAATAAQDAKATWAGSLPGGFVLLSADSFLVNGRNVRQGVYSDGLSTVSLFVTPVPVKAPSKREVSPLELGLPDGVRQWRTSGVYVTAVGALPDPLLAEIEQKTHKIPLPR